MPKHLRRGVKIKLNRFGTFKVIFGGNGQENAEDVTAADIDGTRISFIGASEMKKAVLTDMPFQKVVQPGAAYFLHDTSCGNVSVDRPVFDFRVMLLVATA